GHRQGGVRANDEHHRQAPNRPRCRCRAGRSPARQRPPPQGRERRLSLESRGGKALYGGLPPANEPGLAPQLLRFCDELRGEGLQVGTAEILDAFRALGEIGWSEREDFRETLAATL